QPDREPRSSFANAAVECVEDRKEPRHNRLVACRQQRLQTSGEDFDREVTADEEDGFTPDAHFGAGAFHLTHESTSTTHSRSSTNCCSSSRNRAAASGIGIH